MVKIVKILLTPSGSNVHLSSSLYGPWRPLAGTNLYCNNPSPWRHTNGSLYLLCSHQGRRAVNEPSRIFTGAFTMHCET